MWLCIALSLVARPDSPSPLHHLFAPHMNDRFYSRKGYIEFLATRAWAPPSSLWVTAQPRDAHFASGGWYIEHNKHGRRAGHSSFFQKYKPRDDFTWRSEPETKPPPPSSSSSSSSAQRRPRPVSVDDLVLPDQQPPDATTSTTATTTAAEAADNDTGGPARAEDAHQHLRVRDAPSALDELPSLHHSVSIFTCAFLTLEKLRDSFGQDMSSK